MRATPKSLGFRMPAEWEMQEKVWISWPHNEDTWPGGMLKDVETSYVEFVRVIHAGQKVAILADGKSENRIKSKLAAAGVNTNQIIFFTAKTVDAWIRDYGPTFIINEASGEKAMVKWNFNAWGSKYDELKKDNAIPYEMNKTMKLRLFEPGIVLEGGSIDVNGSGTLLTSEQCLLNRNRNPGTTKKEIEQCLKEHLNVSNILWLREGIAGDDTDGHVDDIARFTSHDTVVCAYEEDDSDENHAILEENYRLLNNMSDEKGNKLKVVKIPMPGFIGNEENRYPASYCNFYIGNKAVAVPIFGHKNDITALRILEDIFPGRKVIGINSREMVCGFGSFHCLSLQEPAV